MFGRRTQTDDDQIARVTVHDLASLDKERTSFDLAGAPKSTTLTANEVYLLEQAGYEVLQVVFGNVVYSMGIRGLFRSVSRAFSQGEMVEFTRMINDAREIARNRMLEEARNLGATLVVNVEIVVNEFGDFAEVTATGTAVVKKGQGTDLAVTVAV